MTTTQRRTPPTMDVVLQNRDRIVETAARHGAVNVGVFGSVGRGDATAESDIDFIVDSIERREGIQYFGQLGDMQREFAEITGYPVDVLDRLGIKPHLRDAIREVVAL